MSMKMKLRSIALGMLLTLAPLTAFAQCSGQAPGTSFCGNNTGSPALPKWNQGINFPGQALSKIDDTNVTLTLGGNPSNALIDAVSIAAGWQGVLSPVRGGTGVNNGSNTITLTAPLSISPASTGVAQWSGGTLGTSTVTIDATGALNVAQDFTNPSGRIIVGTGGSTNSFYAGFVDDRSITGSGTSMHAFADNKIIDASGGFGINSFDARFNVIGTFSYNHIQNFQAFTNFGSTGQVDDWTGYTFNPVLSGGGNVLRLSGMIVGEPTFTGPGGTVTLAAYGIQVGDMTLSGAPFVRAIQTFGHGIAEFGGEVRSRDWFNVTSANPTYKMSSVDPGTGPGATLYGSVSHDSAILTVTNNVNGGPIFFNLSTPTLFSAFRFSPGTMYIFGTTSGSIQLAAPAVSGSSVLTLPVATDTLIGKATTDTLTNKTFDTAGTGNVFKIAGTAISAITGTGSVVLATSPTIRTLLTVSNNAGTAAAAALAGTVSRVIGVDASPARSAVESYGTGTATAFSTMNLRRGNGTAAVPSAVQSGDLLFGYVGTGYGNSVFIDGGGAGMLGWASQTYSNTVGGTELAFNITANGAVVNSEALRILNSGQLKFTGAANFSANGAVATAMSSVGPTGSHTTIQTWLTITDSGGVVRYIPAF